MHVDRQSKVRLQTAVANRWWCPQPGTMRPMMDPSDEVIHTAFPTVFFLEAGIFATNPTENLRFLFPEIG
jgi:hypothetical protein